MERTIHLFVLIALSGLFFANSSCAQKQPQTAAEYLKEGLHLKALGRTELCRTSLLEAIKLDRQGPVGKAARTYMQARLPQTSVTEEAEQENIRAFNLMASGDAAGAIAGFKATISKYPKFEWPYGNLGNIYVKQKRYAEAITVLTKATTINPHYANGWKHLAEAYSLSGNVKAAEKCSENERLSLPKELENM